MLSKYMFKYALILVCLLSKTYAFNQILQPLPHECLRYRSKARIGYKTLNFLTQTVEDHHIIPKQFKNHRAIKKSKFKINGHTNLLIMPNLYGKKLLKLPSHIPYHTSHEMYNKFVGKWLAYLYMTHGKNRDDSLALHITLFLFFLKENLQWGIKDKEIPWDFI